MNNEKITVEIEVNERMDVDIHVQDVMYAVNRLPLKRKWNVIGNILTHLKLAGVDEDGDNVEEDDKLSPEQVEMIKVFLNKQLALLP